MALNKLKVCLIGAGPSGMSVMYHLNKLAVAGKQIPQIKCYEKQSACGGLWNYSWRTGKLFCFSLMMEIIKHQMLSGDFYKIDSYNCRY